MPSHWSWKYQQKPQFVRISAITSVWTSDFHLITKCQSFERFNRYFANLILPLSQKKWNTIFSNSFSPKAVDVKISIVYNEATFPFSLGEFKVTSPTTSLVTAERKAKKSTSSSADNIPIIAGLVSGVVLVFAAMVILLVFYRQRHEMTDGNAQPNTPNTSKIVTPDRIYANLCQL